MSAGLLPFYNGKYGFINSQKIRIIQPQFYFATSFLNNYAVVGTKVFENNLSQNINIINIKGEQLLIDGVNGVNFIYNDITAVKRTGFSKYEYIDLKGRYIFKNKYLRADAFSVIK